MTEAKLTRLVIKERLYRRRYLVPNLVTVGNLFCGFLTIIYASSGRFEKAVFAILIAILLDGLDGRVARRLNATSKFGVEFDSFCDFISFGVAPGMLVYHWVLQTRADEIGVFFTFVYALSAASRLARFNISPENLASFEGLPSPAAAGTVAALVYYEPYVEQEFGVVTIACGFMVFLGYLMVSKISFLSIKQMKVSNFHPLVRIGLGALIALIWYRPRIGLFVLMISYCLSGPLQGLIELHRQRKSNGPPAVIKVA